MGEVEEGLVCQAQEAAEDMARRRGLVAHSETLWSESESMQMPLVLRGVVLAQTLVGPVPTL